MLESVVHDDAELHCAVASSVRHGDLKVAATRGRAASPYSEGIPDPHARGSCVANALAGAAAGSLRAVGLAAARLNRLGSSIQWRAGVRATLAASILAASMLAASALAAPVVLPTFVAQPKPAPDATISYGPMPVQGIDLYLPKTKGPYPVVILIHGGCWMKSTAGRDQLRLLGIELANQRDRGVEHRLSPRRRGRRRLSRHLPGRREGDRPVARQRGEVQPRHRARRRRRPLGRRASGAVGGEPRPTAANESRSTFPIRSPSAR